jgi:hypothetical protein
MPDTSEDGGKTTVSFTLPEGAIGWKLYWSPAPPPPEIKKKRFPRWPRGRWNGRRIVGIQAKVVIDVTCWNVRWPRYGTCLGLGPLRIWFGLEYRWE